jgi:hypothetical protein
MIDTWIRQDLETIFAHHPAAVWIDESGDAWFLLPIFKSTYEVYVTDSRIQELEVKYRIEGREPNQKKCLIYTRTPKKDQRFIREYGEIYGSLEIRYLQNYIKEKVHQTLKLNINLPSDQLLSAAKVSVGKDKIFWMDLVHKGPGEIFDLKKELLPFVHDPKTFADTKYDAQLRDTFYHKINETLGQEYFAKPPETLAAEVVRFILDRLVTDQCPSELEAVYHDWLDSNSYSSSFKKYLDQYQLPEMADVWQVNIHHPFRQIDEQWLKEIGQQLSANKDVKKFLEKIRQRHHSKQAQALGITFWKDVIPLMAFDPDDITALDSFSACVDFYTTRFCPLDTAIRHLYAEFLNNKALLAPFQELYQQRVTVFLDKWFKYFNQYQENQTGTLQRIIDGHDAKTAIIVGDGVGYEVACEIARKVDTRFKLTRDVIVSDIPTETENNMSRIYMDNGVTEKIHAHREAYLREQNPDILIDFVSLDQVGEEPGPGQFLICTYKDIDSIGEKLQQNALKYFPETIAVFAKKIEYLIQSGYAKVFLISDHGFVLTGVLTEADKICLEVEGDHEKKERYVRTRQKQTNVGSQFIEVQKSYGPFGYLYFSQTMSPFKTPGVYGFSHGGITPQEIITPFFCWERSDMALPALNVTIKNKADLKNVTGEVFELKLSAEKGSDDLFAGERKVYLVFFSGKKQTGKSDVFTIEQGQVVSKEYTFDGHSDIEAHLLDAKTKVQLDHAAIHQNKARDLGGLL